MRRLFSGARIQSEYLLDPNVALTLTSRVYKVENARLEISRRLKDLCDDYSFGTSVVPEQVSSVVGGGGGRIFFGGRFAACVLMCDVCILS